MKSKESAQEEVKRIQLVHLVTVQFQEAVDQNYGMVRYSTRSNYCV